MTSIDEVVRAGQSQHSRTTAALPPALAAFVDDRSGLRVEVHDPRLRPDRWRAYLDGAAARYRSHGILHALGRPGFDTGRAVTLVYVAIDATDAVVGGIRCHGPLRGSEQAFALQELAGHPQLHEVRALIDDRAKSGLVEIKGAWIAHGANRPGLSDVLARCHVHGMEWFGARYAMCSAAEQRTQRWSSAGGRVQEGLASISYPDERYQTVLMWWDRAHVEERSTAVQWACIVAERALIAAARGPERAHATTAPTTSVGVPTAVVAATTSRRTGSTLDQDAWRPTILNPAVPVDAARIHELLANPAIEVLDRLSEQLEGLRTIRPPVGARLEEETPVWVHYPWRRSLVRVLGPTGFRTLRLDRNRNKITRVEQEQLCRQKVGVVGLSVGHTIAYALALEGTCAELRLADFDTMELSNLNRIPATVLDLGVNKATILSRRIAELDPFLTVRHIPEGLTRGNIDSFIDGLDVIVEECDSLDLKLLIREAAKLAGIPVLMETSDRGLFDVERYDLDPDRVPFHGLLGDVRSSELRGLTTSDKVPHVLRLLGADELSSRMAASMAEIDETLTTWPQLAGDVSLGAATVAAAVRRLGRGEHLPSGRVRIDIATSLDALAEPPVQPLRLPEPTMLVEPPLDPDLAVAHAANQAPSGGNAQPWSLQLTEGGLKIYLDRSRTTAMDVAYRGSFVAIGAAALNARVAAAAHGVLGRLEIFPEGEGSELVAELVRGRDVDPDLAASYDQVLVRCTNRRSGVRSAIAPGTRDRLHRQVAMEGAELHLIVSEDGLAEYADLLAESDRLRYLSPILHREMIGELRWPPSDSIETGIDVRTLDLNPGDLAKLDVARRPDVMADLASWDGGRALGTVTRDRVRSSSALAVITVPCARPSAYVAAGMAVQRLWLAAQADGLAVQPVSPVSAFAVAEEDFMGLVPAAYVTRLRNLAGRLRSLASMADDEVLALVLRLSYARPPSTRSLRIPLDTVLLGGLAPVGPETQPDGAFER